jgi:hypothetical protein
MSGLSGLVELQHLKLDYIHQEGLPDGLPSQLTKLTCLDMAYRGDSGCDGPQQFQHLSSFAALQQLSVSDWACYNGIMLAIGDLSGAQHLSQLTALKLECPDLEFSPNSTKTWSRLTALHSLVLKGCTVQPGALSKLKQLQAFHCMYCRGTWVREVLADVAQLSQLTLMLFIENRNTEDEEVPPEAAAFTALTASTNLCSLEVSLQQDTQACTLFTPGKVYPHLRRLDLECENWGVPLSKQQLQQLCSCCPALESLAFILFEDPSPEALLPLLQLSALTQLAVHRVHTAEATVVGVVAQLTGLKVLHVMQLYDHTDPTVLQVTALTALEELRVGHLDDTFHYFQDQVSGTCSECALIVLPGLISSG